MRDLLAPLVGYRHQFRAVAERLGDAEHQRLTLLLRDVTWTGGAWVDGHLWVPFGEELDCVRMRLGEPIAFTAVARPYRRKDGTPDFSLHRLGDVRLLRARKGR
jgi:hypothetical protein